MGVVPLGSKGRDDCTDRTRRLGEGTSVLLVGDPDDTYRSACFDLCAAADETNALVVTYDQSPETWLREWQDRMGGPPRRATVVSVGDGTRSAASVSGDRGDRFTGLRIDTVDDPTELEELGRTIREVLGAWAETGAESVLCFRSLTDLLAATDLRTVFRFVHVIDSQLGATSARAHFHLDPSDCEDAAVATLRPLFDAVVRVPEGADSLDEATFEWTDRSGQGADAPPTTGTDATTGTEADGVEPGTIPDAEGRVAGPGTGTGSATSAGAGRDVESADGDRERARPTEGAADREPRDGSASPRDQSVGASAPGGVAVPGLDEPARAVVVDGDAERGELVATVVERDGLSVRTATTASGALDALDDGVDCVVSSHELPDTTGVELAERVRKAAPGVPFVLVLDEPDAELEREALAAGATRCFHRDRDQYRRLADYLPVAVAAGRGGRFREAVEHAGQPVVVADVDGTVEYANPAFEGLTGRAPAEVRGSDLRELFDGLGDAWATVRGGDVWAGEPASGEPAVRHVLSPVTDASGEVTRVVDVLTDVSEYRARERDLRAERDRAEQAVDLLVHDLRNLQQAVEGNLAAARESIDKVGRALERIEGLADDVMTLTGEDAVETVSTRDLEASVRDAWERTATGSATLVVESSAAVHADHDLLAHLLENLLNDAVQHGGEDVTVRVGTLDGEGFYVADDGPGIPPGDHDRVFDEGYSTAGSTGIGLAIVERVADAHGWDVRVTGSDAGGARFEVTGVTTG